MSTQSISTRIVTIKDINKIEDDEIKEAVELIQLGEVVAFPTETVYGLGANALDSKAVDKIFQAKGRPSDNPLIVHISSLQMLKLLVSDNAFPKPGSLVETICSVFWPGPLTLLFEKSHLVPNNVTAGLSTVAVRMPSHKVARRLIELSNVPIAAPSANLSGRPSPTCAYHVFQDMNGRIKCIIDGGNTSVGVESTVIDIRSDPPLILRPGGITLEMLSKYIPSIQVYEKKYHGESLEQKPPTPGLKYKHYSPNAKVILIEQLEDLQAMKSKVTSTVQQHLLRGLRVGIIITHPAFQYSFLSSSSLSQTQTQAQTEALIGTETLTGEIRESTKEREKETSMVEEYRLYDYKNPQLVARGLFGALRDLDSKKVDVIVIEGIPEQNEGMAVMNRLRKASSQIL